MSASATRAFLPTLRRLDRELGIPLPDRLGVLRELEADLEELTSAFVGRGHDLQEARGMALDALVPDGTALGELRRIHSSTYARVSHRFGRSRLRVLERTALVVAATGVMAVEAVALVGAGWGDRPSPFMWPMLGLTGLLFATVAATAWSLWVRREPGGPHRRGTAAVLGLSALVLLTGGVGVTVDAYLLAGAIEARPGEMGAAVLAWIIRDGALLSVSLLASMAGGLAWFLFTQRAASLSAARAETLGLTHDFDPEGE